MISEAKNTAYLLQLKNMLSGATDEPALYNTIVNAPFYDKLYSVQLHLGIIVFLLANEATNTIDRIALSNTELAQGALEVSAKPFHDIKIPLHDHKNIIALAINSGKRQLTGDWKYLFTPALTAEEARFNQAAAAIGCSIVVPFSANSKGALIFSFFQPAEEITALHTNFIDSYTKLVQAHL